MQAKEKMNKKNVSWQNRDDTLTDFGDGPKEAAMGGLNCLVFNWKFSSSQ